MSLKTIQHTCRPHDLDVCFGADEGWHYRGSPAFPAQVIPAQFSERLDSPFNEDFEYEAPEEDNGGSWVLDWPAYVRFACDAVSNRSVRQIIDDLVHLVEVTPNSGSLHDQLAETIIIWAWAGARASMFGDHHGVRDTIGKLVDLGARSMVRITPARPGTPGFSDLHARMVEFTELERPLTSFSVRSLLVLMQKAAPACCGLPRYMWD